jgi:hypothetical protein
VLKLGIFLPISRGGGGGGAAKLDSSWRRSNRCVAARGGNAELQSGVVAGFGQGRGKNGFFAGFGRDAEEREPWCCGERAELRR